MDRPKTLFALANREPSPPRLGAATLILIDYQNEYLDGPLALTGAEEAIAQAERLLRAARRAGGRIVHVAHKGAPGGLFDRSQGRGAIVAALAPGADEAIVEKSRANAFSGTDLAALAGPPGAALIFAGFMTHNCVSSSVRAGKDLGYAMTVAADACATRDLPCPGGVIRARDLHSAELAALADAHAYVCDVAELV
ncbi:MAG: cysteine hydrolase family protein [Roseiarcus sp.]|jgi:nicotinamidase-related amidase